MMDKSPLLFKADLHCHSRYSGLAKHLRFLQARDCYSRPLDVYRAAKERGMDLVTITDHDSLEGCLEVLDRLGEREDFITGEEVSVYFQEFQHEAHVAVYGLDEAQHREIQRLRRNGEDLVAYLRQSNLLFALNHFFHGFSNRRRLRDYIARMTELFDVFEVRNGSQQREHNRFIVSLLEQTRNTVQPIGFIGGSDAHTLRRIARTCTVSSARNREEFIEDIRAGRTCVVGPHSSHLTVAGDIYGVVLRYYTHVLAVRNGEFPTGRRLKSLFLSLASTPFLIAPYLIAIGHAHAERKAISTFARDFSAARTPSEAQRSSGSVG